MPEATSDQERGEGFVAFPRIPWGLRLVGGVLRGHPYTLPWCPATTQTISRLCRCGTYIEITQPTGARDA